MNRALPILLAAVLVAALGAPARAAERGDLYQTPKAGNGAARAPREKPGNPNGDKGTTRPPREKPDNPNGDKGGTRPPREKPDTRGDRGRYEENDHPIRPPQPPHPHPRHHRRPVIKPRCEYVYHESWATSETPWMDTYRVALGVTIITNAALLFSESGGTGFGSAGIALGVVSLAVAPFRPDAAERTTFVVAGLASIALGILNLDEGPASSVESPYRSPSKTIVSVSF
jgi:hypothetical protein